MIIVEHGSGADPASNSYSDLESLQFHGRYYGFPIPKTEREQVDYLLGACSAMDAMGWKGRAASVKQPLAWPRDGIVIGGQFISKTLIPYGVRHGQVMLAIEMYAQDMGIELIEPTHANDNGKLIALSRSCAHYRLDPPLWVFSRTQFADYLVMRGLSIVR